jgi:hypothetical protein
MSFSFTMVLYTDFKDMYCLQDTSLSWSRRIISPWMCYYCSFDFFFFCFVFRIQLTQFLCHRQRHKTSSCRISISDRGCQIRADHTLGFNGNILHDCIISLSRAFWEQTSLTKPFIIVLVPIPERWVVMYIDVTERWVVMYMDVT